MATIISADEIKKLLPDCPDYSKTIIEKNMGEQWFCTESEARKELGQRKLAETTL